MRTVLLLGGTSEARRLAESLAGRLRVVSSLAGRVRDPRLPPGEVRVGGFGGVEGFRAWLLANPVDAVVDATHPFAATMTATAAQVTAELGIPFVVLRRPGWVQQPGDDWRWVDSVSEAARSLPGERVFLTIGREELKEFAHLPQWFLVRSVDPPVGPVPDRTHVLLDRGPFTVDGEIALMRAHDVDVLVAKDSGGEMTAAKLTAARELALPVVIVRRPPLPDVPTVDSVAGVLRWLGTDVA
ncbi:precorrin-6A/cobalt-precorrin-6A reductase [Actinocrispum wychmicini]|uniref:Precorrin-6A/cobalt-precorrin-6A reductase n=1 Tax=Actinocrispum wychmicini TaxID=1213861 RepID=A0A4R2J7M7_9PSEU|nr:cobalt-precorrin-6A reductase [Actinocrispum wychmicini]TCO55143.1 precorrin-6A/cobalt-precorrin-6A reductase [Actinocrispum wychmicini]